MLPRPQQRTPHEISKHRQNGTVDNKDDSNKNGLGSSPIVSIRSSCDTILRYTPKRRSPVDVSSYRDPETGAPRAEVGAGRMAQQPTTVQESIASSLRRKRVGTRCSRGVILTAITGRQYRAGATRGRQMSAEGPARRGSELDTSRGQQGATEDLGQKPCWSPCTALASRNRPATPLAVGSCSEPLICAHAKRCRWGLEACSRNKRVTA